MAILNYTAAKGLFESADANLTGAFNMSDVAVIGDAAPAGEVSIHRIRIYDQAHSDGDDYASLDQLEFTISAEGVSTTFYLDTDNTNQSSSSGTQIALHGLTLTSAVPKDVSDLIATAINNALGTVHAISQAQVGSSGTVADYSDVYVYGRQAGVGFGLDSAGSTGMAVGTVQYGNVVGVRSIDGGAYLAAGRADDIAAVDAGTGGVQLGALDDGTRIGQTICMFNNSSALRMKFTGNFTGGGTNAMVDHGEGSVLIWNGSDWIEWKKYGGSITIS